MKAINEELGIPAEKINTAGLFAKCTGHFSIYAAQRNLGAVIQALNKQGAKHWLHAGTMLGCVRDHGLIPYDNDIDISCLMDQAELVCEAIRDLLSQGFELLRCYGDNALVSIVRENVYIDFYLYAFSGDGYYVNYSDVLCEEDLKTFPCDFLEISVNVLNNPERILEEWYGKDWRIPQRGVPAKPCDRRKRQ